MNSKLTIGYLTYINEKNYQYRFTDFQQSIKSLKTIDFDQCELIQVDNASCTDVDIYCADSNLFNKRFCYKNNFYDISLFYTTMWHAKNKNSKYIGFLYDDSIAYDAGTAIKDSIQFMDENSDVSCLRIARYEHNDKLFDVQFTPKLVNPDSVRHFNSETNAKLEWKEQTYVGNHKFYKCNWHYTSRPCIWKLEAFENLIKDVYSIPVLQQFEKYCMTQYENQKIITGVLNGGLVKTTTVKNSARTNELNSSKEANIRVELNELKSQFESLK